MKNLKQLTLVSALIAAASLGAQENYGTIVGTVRGPNRNPVAGATISLSGSQLLGSRTAVTDAQGRYRLPILLPGQYTVRVSMQGYIGSQGSTVLTGGSTLTVDLNLRQVSTQEEVVEIVATDNPIIDKTETKVATTFTAEELTNVATAGLVGMWAAAYLAPGVQQADAGYDRMRGGMVGATQYMVNGMVTRDPVTGQGRQAELIIEDLIQDVQVIQNPINAKYGFTQSGIIAVNSRTGSNQFKGSIRLHMENITWITYTDRPVWNRWNELEQGSNLSAPYYPGALQNNPRSDSMTRQYDVTLSGPIIKDKLTFIYGAAIRPSVLSLATNRTRILQANALDNRAYLPGITLNDPKFTGPDPTDGNILKENWAAWYWGDDPSAPTRDRTVALRTANDFHSYKLFYQLNPNHQIEYNYTVHNFDGSYLNFAGAWMADGNDQLNAQERSKRLNRGLSYRGIIGSSGVLTAQYATTENQIDSGTGPDDPLYVATYNSNQPFLARRGVSGWSRSVTGGHNMAVDYRANKTYSLDYNHIWENHNIDVGFQMLESMQDRSAYGGANRRVFYALGRRYDGNYLVWNPVDQSGPLWQEDGFAAGIANAAYPLQGGTVRSHREDLFDRYFVSMYENFDRFGGGDTMVKNTTTAFYINDNWTLNNNWAINLGLRVSNSKLNDAVGERFNVTGLEPRFRLQYDMFGDNQHVFAFSATQKGGIITVANVGRSYSVSGDAQNRKYIWDQNNPDPSQPAWAAYFVTPAEIKNLANYGYYWSYSDSALNWFIDEDVKPQQTTEFELNYRRAFGMGGYFRIALVYNFLSNALTSNALDEAIEVADPTGETPSNGLTSWQYVRLLSNDSSRGRHYSSAEIELMMPLVNQASYRLNWFGNWTIAKTTGNSLFSAGGSGSGVGEGESHRIFETAKTLGIPEELMDPWGEINTPRHSIRTWFTFTHGRRGGINNTVTLMAAYSSGSPYQINQAHNIPSDTFQNSTANEGGRITNFPSSVSIFPYGFGYRTNTSSYQYTLQYNMTIPIAKRFSMFVEISVIEPFNNIRKGDVFTSWSDPTRVWSRDGAALENPMFGTRFGNRTFGQQYGVHSIDGSRNFYSKADVGFRF